MHTLSTGEALDALRGEPQDVHKCSGSRHSSPRRYPQHCPPSPRRGLPSREATVSSWSPVTGRGWPRLAASASSCPPLRTGSSCEQPVASVIGFLKGKSAIAIARLRGKERNFSGEHFWARGYAVSTVGFELEQVRQYIREQQSADGTDGQF